MLRKPHLDIAPKFSSEVKEVIGSETCKLVGDVSCEPYVSEYPFDGVEFRRRLEDYENMYVFVSLKLQAPLSESRWLNFQSTLMSTNWLKEVTDKVHIAHKGACVTLTQASYPQQSGQCWSFDHAVNRTDNEPYSTQNEFCSVRLTHPNAHCAIIIDEDGEQKAKRVSIASFDALDCANKVAEDRECGSSFSWNSKNGVCVCSTPGNVCNGAHGSEFGSVYIFRSGNFGYFGYEDEESEEIKKEMEEANGESNGEEENSESNEGESSPSGLLHRKNQFSGAVNSGLEQGEEPETEEMEEAEEEEESETRDNNSTVATTPPGRLARTKRSKSSGFGLWLGAAYVSFLFTFVSFLLYFKQNATQKHDVPLIENNVEPIIL
jgi:hypothetical protein